MKQSAILSGFSGFSVDRPSDEDERWFQFLLEQERKSVSVPCRPVLRVVRDYRLPAGPGFGRDFGNPEPCDRFFEEDDVREPPLEGTPLDGNLTWKEASEFDVIPEDGFPGDDDDYDGFADTDEEDEEEEGF